MIWCTPLTGESRMLPEKSWGEEKLGEVKNSPLTHSLSLSGACHENVSASMSSRHAGLSTSSPGLSWAGADRPQPFSARFASVFKFFVTSLWEDPNAGPESSGVVLTNVGTAQMTKEGHAPLTNSVWQQRLSHMWPNHIIGDKIRPMDKEDASETPIIQCIYLLL